MQVIGELTNRVEERGRRKGSKKGVEERRPRTGRPRTGRPAVIPASTGSESTRGMSSAVGQTPIRSGLNRLPPRITAIPTQFEIEQDAGGQDRQERDDEHSRVDVARLLLNRNGASSLDRLLSLLLCLLGLLLFFRLSRLRRLSGLRLSFEHDRPLESVRCDS